MVNQAAQTLGRLAKGKPKTMSKAAIVQRQRAAKASAKARKGRKRGKTLIQVFEADARHLAKIIKNKACTTETLSYSDPHANTKPTEPNAGSPLHQQASAQREPGT